VKKFLITLTLFCATIFAQNIFTDERDGQEYKIVKIGSQTWMSENLNYNADGSKCYDNKTANCNKYGRLYNWTTANKACPEGWHLPSNDEWTTLTNFVGSSAGTKLKAASGWNANGNGEDKFGFSALPGGFGNSGDRFGYSALGYSGFNTVGHDGIWWSASEYDSNLAYNRSMYFSYEFVVRDSYIKSGLFSVRCLQ